MHNQKGKKKKTKQDNSSELCGEDLKKCLNLNEIQWGDDSLFFMNNEAHSIVFVFASYFLVV